MIAVIAMVVMALALALVVIGLRRPAREVVIEERLAQFGSRVPSLEDLELQEPFKDRVLVPLIRSVSGRVGRLMPQRNQDALRQKLQQAGAPRGLGATEFTGLRLVLSLGFGGGLFILLLIGGGSATLTVLMPLVTAVIGYMLPGVWLDRRIKERQTEIVRALPDAIDLLTISVEAGLGFDPALARVVEKWDNALTREFGRMLSEIRMGQSRRDAMRDLMKRVNVDDLNVFLSAIIQADQLGVSITQVLRVQSRQMRMRRRQRAEELAHKAPIKMIFPMVLLIFPAIYVVVLGPVVPRIWESLFK